MNDLEKIIADNEDLSLISGHSTQCRVFTPCGKEQPDWVNSVVEVFRNQENAISTPKNRNKSDEVLAKVRDGLCRLGFKVENGKKEKIVVLSSAKDKKNVESYETDGFHYDWKCCLEVEASRAIGGNAIYRNIVRALTMGDSVEVLIIAVCNVYPCMKSKDFDEAAKVINGLYNSFPMPYQTVLIGY